MKNKKLALALTMSLALLSLTACGNKEAENKKNANTSNNSAQVENEKSEEKIDANEERKAAVSENTDYFATLKEFGVELKDNVIYYNNKPVKNFVDVGSASKDYSDALYLLDGDHNNKDKVLLVKRDDTDKITAVEEYTREEFENM